MCSSAKSADVVIMLLRYTINPDTPYVTSLIGNYDSDYKGYENLIAALECTWIVLSNLISLNVLIAMMNTTYSQVYEAQDAQWRLQFLEQVRPRPPPPPPPPPACRYATRLPSIA